MPSIWQSFIPYHVIQDLIAHPTIASIRSEQRFEAIALFADVSGFTAISESLGSVGKAGTEELTSILNSYFEPMIDLIQSYGGIIGKFGGDAITVLFPYTSDSRTVVTLRSLQCAIDMQTKMSYYAAISTRAGTFKLEMKIGVATGAIFCTSVGDPSTRLEYIIAGSALDRCADAEHHANTGEIVIHNDILQTVKNLEIPKKGEIFSRLERLNTFVSRHPLPPLEELSPQTIQTLTAYIHPNIAQRIHSGQISFINEHRQVTILFVGFRGFDYDNDPTVGAQLQSYISKVIKIVHRYDGYLNKVDMGDKGSKYIILFGAPIAHEDDAERALRCALELQYIPNSIINIGINTGNVYSGQVGSDARQEYTVMGDAVNLAARLMQKALPGQILVGENTYNASNRPFTWERHYAIQVKGKSEPIGVHQLAELRRRETMRLQEPKYILPMVGRERELAISTQRLNQVLRGHGQIIGITAEAGMGKSRLAAEIIKLSNEHSLTSYGGECLSHGTNTSYLVWRNLLCGFFDLEPVWSLDKQVSHLQDEVSAIDPGFAQRVPLLGLPLNISIPENEVTQSLDAKFRKESLEALLVACLNHRAQERPLLIVLEDCHWIDPLSNDLLTAVGRNISNVPILLLVIHRPFETRGNQPRITNFGHFTEMRLAEFTPLEAQRLIELKLARLFGKSNRPLGDFVERISQRAQGNPFYIDEMINLIHDQGINPSDTKALDAFELPDSLHSLIISRLDQLAEGAKTTLRVASAIGRSFKADWLWGVYPKLGTTERVKEQLEQFTRLDITLLDKPEPELEYIFKHIVTHEVAYESLAVSTRAMLHELIGQYIERSYPNDLERYIDLLAHHFGLSHNTARQLVYFRKAGKVAQDAYANEAALEYYHRLLPLLSTPEQGNIMLRMGHIWRLVGTWDQADDIYAQALRISKETQNTLLQAKTGHAIGTLLRFRGQYEKASKWLKKAQKIFEKLNEKQGLVDTLSEIGIVHWRQGNFPAALDCFEQGREFANEIGDQRGVYRAAGNIGILHQFQGDYSRALDYYEQSYRLAKEHGDKLSVGRAAGNMGNIHLEQGKYSSALANYAENLQIAHELGYRLGISIAVGNIGNIYWFQGDYSAVLACQQLNLQITLELGDLTGVSIALWYLSNAYSKQEQYTQAGELLVQAIKIARSIDTPYELCEFLQSDAALLVRQELYNTARKVNTETLEIATQVKHQDVLFEASVLDTRLSILQGQMESQEAIKEFDNMLAEYQDENEQAAIHYEIWRIDECQILHKDAAAHLYRSLYQQTPNIEYKHRYAELTGKQLPNPPKLPPLPEIVTRAPVDLEKLLVQVDALIKEIEA